jgi:hypothetical protein
LAGFALWRRSHSLRAEIALGFGVVVALMLALGVAFHLGEQRSAVALEKLLDSDNRMADLSLRSLLAMYKARGAERELLLSVDQIGMAQASAQFVPAMKNHLGEMRADLASLREHGLSPDSHRDFI